MRTLFKNARILTMENDSIINGSLIVNDNLIETVGENIDCDSNFDEIIDCEGNLLMPGFKNAHTHSAMTFLRSLADDSSLQDWLFNEIFPREANLHPGVIGDLAKVAILEYLSGGTTACMDMYFFIDEFQRACEEMGFRAVNLAMYDKDSRPIPYILNLYEGNKNNDLVKYVISLHSEYTPTDEMFEKTKELLNVTGSGFYTHLAETNKEVQECIQRRGMSPLQFFDSMGFFKNGGAIYHGVYLSDDDIKLLKERNITVVSCPASNMKLASGIANITKLLKSGVNVALGTDGPASNNALDMFREMYLVTGLQKIATKNPVSIPAFEVLKMATVNGAVAMGLENAKYLKEGQLADLIMIDLSRPSMQPINNIINNLVYSGGKDVVKMTMVNGKILYQDGKFRIKEDVKDIYDRAQKLSEELQIIK